MNDSVQRPAPSAKGRLEKTPVVHLLLYAYEKKLTGTLELEAPDGESAAILFIDGQPAKVRTSVPVMYLGRVLLELGYVDEGTLNRSLMEMSKSKRLHGELLREAGAITDAQLQRALEEQLVRKLHHMVTLAPETTFQYFDSFDALADYGGDEVVSLDPFRLVWTALREAPPWEHVSAALTRVAQTPLRISRRAELARFGLEAREQQLLEVLRAQPMRVSELAATQLLKPRETQLLVYALLITKQLSASQDRDSAIPAPVETASPPRVPQVTPAPGTGPQAPSFSMRSATARPSFTPPPPPSRPSPTPPPAKPGLSDAEIAALPEELRARRSEIAERAKLIDREDYFQMLDVDRNATPEEIRDAFFKLAKMWHPDRLPAPIADVRDACARVFARISEAHATLTEPKKRDNYMKLLAEGGATPEAQATIANVIEAATNFQKAEVLLRRNDLAQAESFCRKAHEADPEQPDYLAMLAWLESMKPENQTPLGTQQAITKLDRAISLSNKCERAYFYRGQLHKRLNNHTAAVKDFRRAADLNPRNIDAVREVRLYEMRSQRGSIPPPPPRKGNTTPVENKSGGLFGKLFKK